MLPGFNQIPALYFLSQQTQPGCFPVAQVLVPLVSGLVKPKQEAEGHPGSMTFLSCLSEAKSNLS